MLVGCKPSDIGTVPTVSPSTTFVRVETVNEFRPHRLCLSRRPVGLNIPCRDGFKTKPLPKLMPSLESGPCVGDGFDRCQPRIEARLNENECRAIECTGFYGRNGKTEFMIFEWNLQVADRAAVGRRPYTDRVHCPWKAIDQTALNELQRFGLLCRDNIGEGPTQKPRPQDGPPVVRQRIGGKRKEAEHAPSERSNCGDCRFCIVFEYGAIGLDQKKVGFLRNRICRKRRRC